MTRKDGHVSTQCMQGSREVNAARTEESIGKASER